MKAARSVEPMWWLLFAAGGTVAAFLLPAQMVLTGFVAPLGWAGEAFTYERIAALVAHPLTRVYLFVAIALPLCHWAHRFRYGLVEGLQIRRGRRLLAWACYGTAVVLSAAAAVLLITP